MTHNLIEHVDKSIRALTPIDFNNELFAKNSTVKQRNYFPNAKVEMMILEWQKTHDTEVRKMIMFHAQGVVDAMIHQLKLYELEFDELRAEGAMIIAEAIRWFDPKKPGATSSFSYFSWALYRSYITVMGKKRRWYAVHKLFETSPDDNEDKYYEDDHESSRLKELLRTRFQQAREFGQTHPDREVYLQILGCLERSYETSQYTPRRIQTQIMRELGITDREMVSDIFEDIQRFFKDVYNDRERRT